REQIVRSVAGEHGNPVGLVSALVAGDLAWLGVVLVAEDLAWLLAGDLTGLVLGRRRSGLSLGLVVCACGFVLVAGRLLRTLVFGYLCGFC
ncbi:hypothetical protein L915_07002, partial [Phytophthora nicotianae]